MEKLYRGESYGELVRKINDAFTEFLNTLDGKLSDTDVSVAQALSSGTEIGSITINGTTYKLYAPTSEGSTSGRYLHELSFDADTSQGIRMYASIITPDATPFTFSEPTSYLQKLSKELLYKNVLFEWQGMPFYGIVTWTGYEDYMGFTVTISATNDSEYMGSDYQFTFGGSGDDYLDDYVTEV